MKAVEYVLTACEMITHELLEELEERKRNAQVVGLGIYSDEYFFQKFGRKPLRNYSDRAKLAKAIKHVDFVFEYDSNTLVENEAKHVEEELIYTEATKKFHVCYAPGTYDLFHEGHLEHLIEVKSLCDILVVGVNSDALVFSNKGKYTKMNEQERVEVVQNLKFVDYVFCINTNDKSVANQLCREKVGAPIDAIVFGSDLKNQKYLCNEEGIPVFFTVRDPYLMQFRSSTYYRQRLEMLQKKNS